MVPYTGTPAGAGALRSLNVPEPLEVRKDGAGQPTAIRLRHRWINVEAVDDMWRIDDEWWRGAAISRVYYGVLLEGGHRETLFRDLMTGLWFMQRS